MLSFKTYLTEAKKKKKKKSEEDKHYHKVFLGKMDIDDDKKYQKAFAGKDKIDEAFLPDDRKIFGRNKEELRRDHLSMARHYKYGKKITYKYGGFTRMNEPLHSDPFGEAKSAIFHYTGAHYRPINKALFRGDKSILDHHQLHVHDELKKAVRTHRTREDMTVHTGMKRDPRTFEQHEGKIKVEMPAFTSTTIHKSVAEDFARHLETHEGDKTHSHILHLDIPKGSHGSYVAHHSKIPDEKEFILHPNARVHIDPEPLHIEEHPASWGDRPHDTYHWKGRLVHDGVKDV